MGVDAPGEAWPRGGEWNWLWEIYVVGLCAAAAVAAILLGDRYPSHVLGAVLSLTAMALVVLTLGRRVTRLPELDWRTVVFVGVVVGLWVLAMLASPVAVAAVPAIYPVVFSTLPLRTALVVTTVVTVIPVSLLMLQTGLSSPNLSLAVTFTLIGVVAAPVIGTVIITSIRQRRQLSGLVAELAASRAESARLSREAGISAERERLAREIHDTLAQGFTSIVTLAQAVEPELYCDTAAARRHVALIATTARENLAEARAMVAELTPSPLATDTLSAAIRRLCDRLTAETDIAVTVHADGDLPTLTMATDVVLLRAAQEAIANIRRHSNANAVTVELSATGAGTRLSFADNGIGVSDEHGEGFGLRGMRARTAQVGGTMTVSPSPAGGTTVTVEVPS